MATPRRLITGVKARIHLDQRTPLTEQHFPKKGTPPRAAHWTTYAKGDAARHVLGRMNKTEDAKAFVDWALSHGWVRGLDLDRFPDNNGPYAPWNCRIVKCYCGRWYPEWGSGWLICRKCRKPKHEEEVPF